MTKRGAVEGGGGGGGGLFDHFYAVNPYSTLSRKVRTAYVQRTETSIRHASSGSSKEVKNNGKFSKLYTKRDRVGYERFVSMRGFI